jgi:hypothetical protein
MEILGDGGTPEEYLRLAKYFESKEGPYLSTLLAEMFRSIAHNLFTPKIFQKFAQNKPINDA